MFKTFKDFVILACRAYRHKEWKQAIEQMDKKKLRSIFIEMKNEVLIQLSKHFLKPRMIVSFINWAGTPHLTVREIAKKLKVDKSGKTIVNDLHIIRDIWPHLFEFGPKIPRLKDMAKLPEDFDQYLADGHNVEKF